MKLNLDKNKRYIIACSYGPDSMALLDMAQKDKLDIVVAHVNYHKRDVSNFEEESLRRYCKERNIPIEVLDTSNLKQIGNFQKWARDIRYDFFEKVAKKYKTDSVLVAHQQDDFIETLLMQKKRGNYVKNLGIAEIIEYKQIKIIRPLLNVSKEKLLRYNKDNSVPYSIDSSNLSDAYERNKIRHQTVEKLNADERKRIVNEASNLSNRAISFKTSYDISEFLSLSDRDITLVLGTFTESKDQHRNISSSFVKEIRKALVSSKANVVIPIWKNLFISKEYYEVFLVDANEKIDYMYLLNDRNSIVEDELFSIDFRYSNSDRKVLDSSFPITIKPISKKDLYQIGNYKCEVKRLFIDWKVPHHLRECWPGIYDKNNKLIYVPRYRMNFVDNHPTKFLIKFAINK